MNSRGSRSSNQYQSYGFMVAHSAENTCVYVCLRTVSISCERPIEFEIHATHPMATGPLEWPAVSRGITGDWAHTHMSLAYDLLTRENGCGSGWEAWVAFAKSMLPSLSIHFARHSRSVEGGGACDSIRRLRRSRHVLNAIGIDGIVNHIRI